MDAYYGITLEWWLRWFELRFHDHSIQRMLKKDNLNIYKIHRLHQLQIIFVISLTEYLHTTFSFFINKVFAYNYVHVLIMAIIALFPGREGEDRVSIHVPLMSWVNRAGDLTRAPVPEWAASSGGQVAHTTWPRDPGNTGGRLKCVCRGSDDFISRRIMILPAAASRSQNTQPLLLAIGRFIGVRPHVWWKNEHPSFFSHTCTRAHTHNNWQTDRYS